MARRQENPQIARPNLTDMLRQASQHHQRGQLREAEALYRQILDAQPDHFDALHLYGVLMHQHGQPAEALKLIGRALKANARAAPAHSNRGVVLAVLERHEEALASYDRAIALKPDYAEAFNNRGNVLVTLGRAADALASFEQALARKPAYPGALIGRAVALRLLRRDAEAADSYAQALAIDPNQIDALIGLGNTLHAEQRYAEALACFERTLALRPGSAEILNNRGNALWCLRRPLEALASYDAALSVKPDYAQAHNNRGNALVDLNRPADALASFDRALTHKPDFAEACVNRGNALRDLRRDPEALASFDRAITLEPRLAEAHWNKALLSLSRGDYANGWRGYEWRWRRAGAAQRDFAQAQWQGQDLAGKTILVHCEQGFGDTIQFVRYVPMFATKGGAIVLEAPDSLRPLLSGIEGVAAIVRRGEPLPAFDFHCPLLSLPLAFGTTRETIPASVPYLRAPGDRVAAWRERLPRTGLARIGLAWSGKPTHNNDHNRSIALERFAPLLSEPAFEFVSLQSEYRDADRPALAKWNALRRLDDAIADFADTAAVIEQLDLVIAVDTAVAHLAGAMGKPVWILLPQVVDWRWMLDREDSPWYPSARLFRQPEIGNWDSVIVRIGHELRQNLAVIA